MPLDDLLGKDVDVPMLLKSPTVDLDQVFSDRRVDAPQIEFSAKALLGAVLPPEKAVEPLREAARALTLLLGAMTAEDAARYGKATAETEEFYREFGRLAQTDEDRNQLRILAERASPFGHSEGSPMAAISGRS